jgi:hypothetical protein
VASALEAVDLDASVRAEAVDLPRMAAIFNRLRSP